MGGPTVRRRTGVLDGQEVDAGAVASVRCRPEGDDGQAVLLHDRQPRPGPPIGGRPWSQPRTRRDQRHHGFPRGRVRRDAPVRTQSQRTGRHCCSSGSGQGPTEEGDTSSSSPAGRRRSALHNRPQPAGAVAGSRCDTYAAARAAAPRWRPHTATSTSQPMILSGPRSAPDARSANSQWPARAGRRADRGRGRPTTVCRPGVQPPGRREPADWTRPSAAPGPRVGPGARAQGLRLHPGHGQRVAIQRTAALTAGRRCTTSSTVRHHTSHTAWSRMAGRAG